MSLPGTPFITFPEKNIPVLLRCDALVLGGSLAGISTALQLARAGKQVALIEPRTYLGREICATLRPWLRIVPLAELPEAAAACVEACGKRQSEGFYTLHPDAVKSRLEELLLDAGVRIVYACTPLQICERNGQIEGVVVGNKSGRQWIGASLVVDASETGLLAQMSGAQRDALSSNRFTGVLEYEGANPGEARTISLPEQLARDGARAVLRPGWRGARHWLVEYTFCIPSRIDNALALTDLEITGRQVLIELAAWLAQSEEMFRGAYLAAISPEIHGIKAARLGGEIPEWAGKVGAVALRGKVPLSAAVFAGNLAGLWHLNESARVGDDLRDRMGDPETACWIGEGFGKVLAQFNPVPPGKATQSVLLVKEEPPFSFEVREFTSPQRGRRFEQYATPTLQAPVLADVDVLVVGGGTSGAIAAITAARSGLRTALVEMNPGLGGTGTYGGVHSYWFGRRVGFSAQVMDLVDHLHDRLRTPRQEGAVPKWNIEAKVTALIEAARQAGVVMLLNAPVFATVMDGVRVRGVVAGTRVGSAAVLARQVIDATGDGDVAAFAGARFVYGSERDHSTMWYALAQYPRPGITRNNFTSTVDVGNIEDYTRAILAARRRGKMGEDHDHGAYIAPRESRHIRAAVTMTLSDQLLRRCWPDVINIAFSNNDIKGQSTSDWIRMGLISPNLEIEIPYRALLPDGLENILVVGKAFSATHDSLPSLRMQPDLENLGGAAALAAGLAAESGSTIRQVDLHELQKRLVEAGILPPSVLFRRLVPHRPSEEQLRAWIDQLDGSRPLYTYSDMEINAIFDEDIPIAEVCCAGSHAIPLLEEAYRSAAPGSSRRRLLAQALAMVRSRTGVPELVDTLLEMLKDGLPPREGQIRHANQPPDQGAMPDAAFLLYSLGMAGDERAIPVWKRAIEWLRQSNPEDLRDRQKGIFYYVDAVCYGIERLGNPEAVASLMELHQAAPFHNQWVPLGGLRTFQPDFFEERQAYLELVIGRALARCGSPFGHSILISYLNDSRALLAEQAHDELRDITGADLGKDVSAWKNWLEVNGDEIKPCPWTRPTDAQAAWGEALLRPAPAV